MSDDRRDEVGRLQTELARVEAERDAYLAYAAYLCRLILKMWSAEYAVQHVRDAAPREHLHHAAGNGLIECHEAVKATRDRQQEVPSCP